MPSDDRMCQFIKLLIANVNEKHNFNAKIAYVNMTNASGKFALCLAAENGGTQAMKLLMEYSTPDASQRLLALQCAVTSNRPEILEALINSFHSNKPSKFKRLIHLVIAQNKNRSKPSVDTTKDVDDIDKITPYIITTYNSSDDDYDENGFTPLLLAAKCGNFNCFKLLLDKTLDKSKLLEKKTRDRLYRKLNILHLCAEQQNQSKDNDVVVFVYNSKQKTIKVKDETVPVPISDKTDGYIDICKYIFSNKQLSLSDSFIEFLLYDEDDEGNTPLHLACEQSYGSMCQLLVGKMEELSKNNRYLKVQDLKKRTPLHECAQNGDLELLEILLSPKTNTNKDKQNKELLDTTRDDLGRTPLHLACVKGS